ncbi:MULTISPECIES: hypothetical protein [unclassified Serratia (in: enterobacteria)]|uniref:hypothetical protein n=1 Tax=unclassified Serratia (in: enterobacteria) TaxID=2647522 RepID=UPI0018AAE4E3|nr:MULTISPECIES: hypothetical protein [unclassified Serratia (in: enterobacteria)]
MPYIPNPQHRNAAFAAQKTQWIVPLVIEEECYNKARQEEWAFKACYWAIYWDPVESKVTELGVAPPPISCNVHIAKFVSDSHDNWHGYPVAHWRAPFDRPDTTVLRKWLQDGLITTPKMSKIIRGKKCAL